MVTLRQDQLQKNGNFEIDHFENEFFWSGIWNIPNFIYSFLLKSPGDSSGAVQALISSKESDSYLSKVSLISKSFPHAKTSKAANSN